MGAKTDPMENPNLKTLGISLGDTKIFIPAVGAPVTLIYPDTVISGS